MKKQKGFSLVETSIVIAISVLMLGSIAGYRTISREIKIDSEVSNITELKRSIKSFYDHQESYAGANTAAIVNMNFIPKGMIKVDASTTPPSGVVRNSFDGQLTFTPIPYFSADITKPAGLRFTTQSIPAAACQSLVNRLQDQFPEILVGATVIKSNTVVFDFAALDTACTAQPIHAISFTIAR